MQKDYFTSEIILNNLIYKLIEKNEYEISLKDFYLFEYYFILSLREKENYIILEHINTETLINKNNKYLIIENKKVKIDYSNIKELKKDIEKNYYNEKYSEDFEKTLNKIKEDNAIKKELIY